MNPKILLLDIETAPANVYVWGLWNQNIGLNQIISPSRVICFGAKWLGKKEIIYADERSGPERMFRRIHALLSEADAVITYNGDKFDIPRLNGAFVEYGFDPLPPLASIDLLKTVRKLGAQSNKLAYIVQHLKIGAKVNAGGMALWTACLEGNKDAWDRMRKYNEQDVRLLGRLYDVLRPYIRNHPRLFPKAEGDLPTCRVCNGRKHHFRGFYYTKELQYRRFQCQGCGTWDKVIVKKDVKR